MTAIVFRGTGPIYPELLGNRVDLVCDQTTGAIPQIQGGKVRALAVASAQRLPQLPNVPTAAEAGMPGLEFASWYGIWGPKGLPRGIVARINAEMQQAMAEPAVVRRLTELGIEPVSGTAAEFAAFIERDVERNAALVRLANFQPD